MMPLAIDDDVQTVSKCVVFKFPFLCMLSDLLP